MRCVGRRGSSRQSPTRSGRVAGLALACSAALTAGALLGAAAQTPQSSPTATPRPQFRSGVLLVEVDVTAIDDHGHPVTDLRQEEFEVDQDGHAREIVSFARVDIPVPPPRPLAHLDVATNAGADRSRIVFLVLDDANSRARASSGAREAAKELLARLAPEDRVGMLFVSRGGKGAFEFTTDHAGLAAALDAFEGEIVNSGSRLPHHMENPSPRLGPGDLGGEFPDLPIDRNLKTEFDRLRPFGMVADVSAYLASLPHRRKALVYIGESLEPMGPESPGGDDWAERRRMALRRAVTTARRANVAVYLLDPRRPLREGAEDLFDADRPRDLARLRAGDLSTLAELTGGSSSLNRAIVSQIDRIVTDASAYYLLGYRTDPAPAPGLAGRLHRMASPWAGFRPIEVRTSRPGVRLRARRGYWPQAEAERGEPSRSTSSRTDAASEALRGLVPRPALALASFAAPFRGRDGKPVIAIAVEVQDAAFAAAAASGLDETLAVSLVAAEPGEKVRAADRFTARMRLGSDKAVALTGGRYLVCATLPVSARRYQLRIGVQAPWPARPAASTRTSSCRTSGDARSR